MLSSRPKIRTLPKTLRPVYGIIINDTDRPTNKFEPVERGVLGLGLELFHFNSPSFRGVEYGEICRLTFSNSYYGQIENTAGIC